jgi:excisionase family DNA binding protein
MSYDFEPLIDCATAAALLGIHEKTLQRMAREGRVPAIRVGKFWRFRKSVLNTWLESGVEFPCYAYRLKENKS